MAKNELLTDKLPTLEQLYQKDFSHIQEARYRVQRSINTEKVRTYWSIGRHIIEAKQKRMTPPNVLNVIY